MKNNKGFTLIEVMIVVCIIGIFAAVAIPIVSTPNGIMPNYSNGDRTGIVNKLSEKGIIYKSWEGELIMIVPGNINPETFTFTVDPRCLDKVKEAFSSGEKRTLCYHQYLLKPWKTETRYIISDVKK